MSDEKKGTQQESYGFVGYFLFIIGLAGITALLLFIFQGQLERRGVESSFAWILWASIFSTLLLGLLVMKFWWRLKQAAKQIFYKPHKNGKSESENTPQKSANKNINSDIKASLQKQYGRFWPRKVRILLLTGSAADVEQLAPNLTSQYWQEDSGTVLLWGGDLGAPADNAWLSALRKLRRRPLDGVVWVTSAFVRQSETKNTLSADMMDNVSQAFAARYEQLGWRLPLYVWSLHPSESTQSERITQSVGCLLPASCKPEELRVLLAALVPELIEQGTQQVITRSQHLFLLQLADQLAHNPDSVAAPLATLLNPYRPLPLAGVIFSPVSIDAKRSVKHHWGKDNRWDVLLNSLHHYPQPSHQRR